MASDLDELAKEIKSQIWDELSFDDDGKLCIEINELSVDITDIPVEDFEDECTRIVGEITKSGGGDPGNCAEGGRKRCGNCRGCDDYSTEYEATLVSVEKKEDKVFARYSIS